jgi:hypothetical protein
VAHLAARSDRPCARSLMRAARRRRVKMWRFDPKNLVHGRVPPPKKKSKKSRPKLTRKLTRSQLERLSAAQGPTAIEITEGRHTA